MSMNCRFNKCCLCTMNFMNCTFKYEWNILILACTSYARVGRERYSSEDSTTVLLERAPLVVIPLKTLPQPRWQIASCTRLITLDKIPSSYSFLHAGKHTGILECQTCLPPLELITLADMRWFLSVFEHATHSCSPSSEIIVLL